MAIMALACFRAGDLLDCIRLIEGCEALNQSPPCLMPSFMAA